MGDELPSGMGESKAFDFIAFLLPAIVHAVIVYVAMKFEIDLVDNAWNDALVGILGAFITFGFQVILLKFSRKIRKYRAYGKYEGRWLQVIPEREHFPYTIFDFKYNKEEEKYEIEGYNFCNRPDVDGRKFKAYRLLERSKHDGYYYITDRTQSGTIGMGKLYYDDEGRADGFTRAYGFFCDVDNGPDAKKYETRMIRCDEAFCKKLVDRPRDAKRKAKKLAKMSMQEAMLECRTIADQEIDIYWRTKRKILAETQ
ncbi:MAG: hypothetical protein IJO05_08965 [Oscillospiraceae bacterium]|nr:hypothetical protein [Oscillospiraceae bacterium]